MLYKFFFRTSIFFFSGLFALCLLFVVVGTASAQEAENEPLPPSPSIESVELKARAGQDRHVIIGRTVLFDASASTVPLEFPVQYHWDFGDGVTAEGIDATHTYTTSGTYRVRLSVTLGEGESKRTAQDTIIVAVQDRLIVLIADKTPTKEQIEELQELAVTQGALIVPIIDSSADQEYIAVQNIAQQMLKNAEDVRAADILITWTSGNVGLNSLVELSRIAALNHTSLESFRFTSKAIVAIQDQSIRSSAKIAQNVMQSLKPLYVVVSDQRIFDDVLRLKTPAELQKNLATIDADHQIVTEYTTRGFEELSPLNVMSYMMSFMINKGVPINSLFLILMLPVMATIIAASRQVIGIKAFGIFAPTVIALSFLVTGLKYGIAIFISIILLGTVARILARRFRLLYLPRMAIVLSILALAVFCMFFVGAFFNKTGFLSVSIFPILIMTVLTENFIAAQIENGYRFAVKLTFETLALSMVGYFIGDWTLFKTTILAYPELIFLTFFINYILGKFSGLRLTEFIRFRKVFKHARDVEGSK